MKIAKRLTALLLALIITVLAVPFSAEAGALDNDGEYNEEILDALKSFIGSEKEAKRYYEVLEKYGLLDESGVLGSIKKITIDDEEYTLEEVVQILKGDYDGDKIAIVDGQEITLDNLWNIIVIEDYIEYLRKTYYEGGEWTEEHEATYEDLVKYLTENGVAQTLPTNPYLEGEYSGVNHGAIVSFTATPFTDNKSTVTVTLNAAKAGTKVSFDYRAFSGSYHVVEKSGSIELTADDRGRAETTITITGDPETISTLVADEPMWYFSASNLKNAAFLDSVADAVALAFPGVGTVGAGKELDRITGNFEKYYIPYFSNPSGFTIPEEARLSLTSGELYSLNQGFMDTVSETNVRGGTMIAWYSTEEGAWGKSKVRITYRLCLDTEYDDVIFTNDITMDTQESPSGSGRYSSRAATYNTEYKQDVSIEGIHVNNDIYALTSCDVDGLSLRFKFTDKTAPVIDDVYATPGDYTSWQAVPIIVEFNEPVSPAGAYIIANGTKIPAAEDAPSDRLSFPYPVKIADSVHPVVTEVYAKDVAGNAMTATNPGETSEGLVLTEASMESCRVQDTFDDATAVISTEDPLKPHLTVTLQLSEESDRNMWLASDLDEKGVSSSVKLAIKDRELIPFKLEGETFDGAVMTAELDLEPVYETKEFTAEIYIGEDVLFGSLMRLTQDPITYITAEDITLSVIVKNAEDGPYFDEEHSDGIIYIQDEPKVNALFTLEEGSYTYGDTTKVTIYDEEGEPQDPDAMFVWSSTDPEVANIAADGTITPTGKAGSTTFTLTALNGDAEHAVTVSTDEVRFGAGLTPFLTIPADTLETPAGKPVTVFFSSNLLDKDPEQRFCAILTDAEGNEVFLKDDINTCAVTIPGEELNYGYEEGAAHRYKLTVSATYETVEYSDDLTITLVSAPAIITLAELPTYYYLDNMSEIPAEWFIRNFDRYSGEEADLFRFLVTRNNEPIFDSTNPGTGEDGIYSGSYMIPISTVETTTDDPTSFRDIYTVTVQAKNGTDSTWSYASYVFYVYDEDALKLWVNGSEATGDITLTNVPDIKSMTQDQILALKRDISLQTVISINYGEFAWTDLSDRLAWASSAPEISDLNYRQGSYYEHLSAYNYTTYLPTTEFMLSGLSDGEADITAQHIQTGMGETIHVSVDTLKDQLYLFSCTPAATVTAHYTNGNGEEKTATSDAEGKFAIYEESGIASDVYFTSTVDGVPYYGTYYEPGLMSGEQDPTDLTLYPCNNLIMRRAAYAYVYVKNPNGTPYQGTIKLRGGVFINGEYVENTAFAFKEGDPVSHKGNEWSEVTLGSNGKLTVVMDLTQWGLGDYVLSSEDEVYYRFAIEGPDTDLYPMLVQIDALENEESYLRSGGASVTFRKNKAGAGEHPFIFDENLVIHASYGDFSAPMDILERNESIGVSDLITAEDLTISVMWWGDTSKADKHSLSLYSLTRKEINPKGKTVTEDAYPFLDEPVTTISVQLTHDVLSACDIGVRPETVHICYENLTQNTTITEDLTYGICDMTDIYVAPDGLEKDMIEFNKSCERISTDHALHGLPLGIGDMLPQWAIDKLADEDYKPDKEHANGFSLQIRPTEDPQTYLIYFATGGSNMSNNNVTGIYADGTSKKYFSFVPGFREVKWVFGGKRRNYDWWDSMEKEAKDARDSKWQVQIQYILTGYAEAKYYYDEKAGAWRTDYLSAGFDAGGGVSFVKYFNTLAFGWLPVTTELKGGGAGSVSLDVITMQYLDDVGLPVNATEFLTEFRAYFYFKAFGGIGFDFSVFALKIGIYGQLNFDVVCHWLNRPDLEGIENPRYADGSLVSNSDPVLDGQHLVLGGQIGIEWALKFLFIVYEQALWSLPFEAWSPTFRDWKKIEELWGISQEHYQEQLDKIIGDGDGELVSVGGTPMLKVSLAPTTERFDYLAEGGRVWDGNTFLKDPLKAIKNKEASVLQSNAYPYSDPALNDDGSVLVYLSDATAEEDDAVHTGYAVLSGGGFTEMGLINEEGAGDSTPSAAGNASFTVAAWSSLGEAQAREAGTVMTAEDQIIMLDGTEVYASIYTDGEWTTTALSENSSADIAPAAAAAGGRALVAWRNVATNRVSGNIGDFNVKDTIVYRIYEDGAWSEVDTLYNGTSGNIKGLNAAMLPDGTAAVVYVLDTDGIDSTTEDREICWAVVGTDGAVTRTVQATSDANADENPQVAVTSIYGQNCFVAAWYSTEYNGDELEYDIHMADFGADGIIIGHLPQSVNQLIRDKDLMIAPEFQLTKNSSSLDDLALIWVERVESESEDGLTIEQDMLNSVKFYTYGETDEIIGLTAAQELGEAPESTLINNFDAVCRDSDIMAVFLGTSYDSEETQLVSGTTVSGDPVEYLIPKSTSALYAMRGTYTDSVIITSVVTDYDGLRLGADTTAAVTVKNDGIDPITSVTVYLGDEEQTFDGLNLLPGDSLTLYMDYTVPEDTTVDEDVTVVAETENGSFTDEYVAPFGSIDLEVTSAKIVEEGDGLRTIEVKLNNASDSKLEGSGKTVVIAFYTDSTLENTVNGLDPITIRDSESLKMIDEGGYARRVVFDVEKYLTTLEEQPDEIPEAGIPVYVRVYAMDGSEEARDYSPSNDSQQVRCENLKTRTGNDVTVKSKVKSEADNTEVNVSVRNNRLAETSTGNIVVTLYDAEGNVLEQQQSYDLDEMDCGLVSIDGEETIDATFLFNQPGDHVEVLYSDLILDDDSDASLTSLESTNIPGVNISIFEEDATKPGTFNGEVTAEEGTKNGQFLITPANPESTVTLDGEQIDGHADVPLKIGRNVLDFTVTAPDGKTVNHYILVINVPGDPTDPVNPPRTGDKTHLGLYAALMLLSAAVPLIKRRKKAR